MEYAINTSAEVIHAAGRYYVVEHGVRFVADSALGPWAVADMIPGEIYPSPDLSPLSRPLRINAYVTLPEYVYVGYTPGHTGAFVTDGVWLLQASGWANPGRRGFFPPFYCFGWPWTWGIGIPSSYWAGGWFWRPAGNYWWYHNTPVSHRIFSEH